MTPEEQEKLQGHNQFISAAAGLHANRKLSQTNESIVELRKLLVQKEQKDEQEKDFQNRLFEYKTLFENASQTGLPLNSNEAREMGELLIDRPFERYLNSNLYSVLDYKELSQKTAKIIADFEKQFNNYHPSVTSTIRSERQKEQTKRAEQYRLLKDELVAKERFKAEERKQFIYDFFYGAWWFAVVPFIFITNIAIFLYQPAADYRAQMGLLYKIIWSCFSGIILGVSYCFLRERYTDVQNFKRRWEKGHCDIMQEPFSPTLMSEYHFILGNNQLGPYSADQIKELIAEKCINANTSVKATGGEWKPANTYPELWGSKKIYSNKYRLERICDAADRGVPDAHRYLAIMYWNGVGGLLQDEKYAYVHAIIAAQKGCKECLRFIKEVRGFWWDLNPFPNLGPISNEEVRSAESIAKNVIRGGASFYQD